MSLQYTAGWAVAIAIGFALAGCSYRDSFRDCTVACTPEIGCPDGFTCAPEGLCRPQNAAGTCSRSDAAPAPDAPDAPAANGTCFGSGAFEICTTATPAAELTLAGMIYTSSGSNFTVDSSCLGSDAWQWQGSGQPDACVMFAHTVQLGTAHTQVFGARPLVILATGSITIAQSQQLDVASHRGAQLTGPGAASGTCAPFTSQPHDDISNDNGTSGGGAGGTFATGTGASGGTGDGNSSGSQAGGHAATSAVSVLDVLTAGCTGQTGPGGTQSGASPGGAGGGAVYLASRGAITISGIIDASGAGASGGGNVTGGGGGGAGGMVVIDAPTITATAGAIIVANGGGGASGGFLDVTNGLVQANGVSGNDPDPTTPETPAAGGPSGGAPGAGGAGYAAGMPAVAGGEGTNNVGNGDSGGGGGGGGGGVIIAPAGALSSATVSPPVTSLSSVAAR